jgi:hypothetical protein
MPLYPESIARCQHLKVNGTQCGSPALRDEKFCYFHLRWRTTSKVAMLKQREDWRVGQPTLEDANSIQVGLAEVMRLLVTQELDHKTAYLLLYAMQTASANMKHTSFEPEPTHVVIDHECVERRPLGATAWSAVAGREYDEVRGGDLGEKRPNEDDLARIREQEGNGDDGKWWNRIETPENERLLPNESQRDRYVRVQKQRGLEVDPARL